MKLLKMFFVFIPLFFSGLQGLTAQITLGSTLKPADGALLDLKEQTGDFDSTKGLNLPRVALTSRYNLTPMFENVKNGTPALTDFSAYVGANKAQEDLAHVGLLVYNTTNAKGFCKGMYVWDGEEWKPLGFTDYPPGSVSDNDGNTYATNWYGTCESGNYWMAEDMRTTLYPNGSPIPIGNHPSQAHLTYPYQGARQSDQGNNPATYNLFPKMGLLYTQYAALAGEAKSTAGVEVIKRGICPEGWALPNRNSLISLFAIVNEQSFLYANLTEAELIISPSWPIERKTQKILSSVTALPNTPAGTSTPAYLGRSFPAKEGGFDMYPTGYHLLINPYWGSNNYGSWGYLWTSDVGNGSGDGISLDMTWGTTATYSLATQHSSLNALGVRCYKPR